MGGASTPSPSPASTPSTGGSGGVNLNIGK
jgi:hypothetical protein